MGNGQKNCWCSITNIDKERQLSFNFGIIQNDRIISTQNYIISVNHNEEINNSQINFNILSENNSSYDISKNNCDIDSQLSSRKLLNIDKLSPEKKTCIICLENFKESDKNKSRKNSLNYKTNKKIIEVSKFKLGDNFMIYGN